MTQSADRVSGRRGIPASFGRTEDPAPEDFKIQGGAAIHVVVHAQVVPDAASLEAAHAAIRAMTRSAVLAGYADAFAEMDADEEQPDEGDGGSPPG